MLKKPSYLSTTIQMTEIGEASKRINGKGAE